MSRTATSCFDSSVSCLSEAITDCHADLGPELESDNLKLETKRGTKRISLSAGISTSIFFLSKPVTDMILGFTPEV